MMMVKTRALKSRNTVCDDEDSGRGAARVECRMASVPRPTGSTSPRATTSGNKIINLRHHRLLIIMPNIPEMVGRQKLIHVHFLKD